ncbi:unnamed protein product [Effrenium voratum]|nr:unnamed protein product [Effrenium voratum]
MRTALCRGDCSSEDHNVCGPELQSRQWCWCIGSSFASLNDTVTVYLELEPTKKVTWSKD